MYFTYAAAKLYHWQVQCYQILKLRNCGLTSNDSESELERRSSVNIDHEWAEFYQKKVFTTVQNSTSTTRMDFLQC